MPVGTYECRSFGTAALVAFSPRERATRRSTGRAAWREMWWWSRSGPGRAPPCRSGPVQDHRQRGGQCDAVAFFGIDTSRRAFLFEQNVPPDEDADDDDPAFWDNYWDCRSCSYFDRSGDLRSVVKDSDFYSVRQWNSTGLYTDYYRPYGTEHELATAVSSWPGQAARPRRTVRLVFFRGPGPDFSERDRALLALLRPHLYPGLSRRRTVSPWHPGAYPAALGVAAPSRRRAH